MRALSYLFFTTVKNTVRETLHRPSKLIVCLLFAALLVFSLFTASKGGPPENLRDGAELSAMVLALYACVFVLTSMHGLSSGATFFSMADVGLLFPAPLSKMRVLWYGVLKQMGTSLLVGFFLAFQYSWLHMAYGLTLGGLLVILLGYAAVLFCAQLTAMAIYAFSSASEGRRRAVKAVLYGACALGAAAVLLPAASHWQDVGGFLAAAVGAASSPLLSLFPVAGWLRAAAGLSWGGGPLPTLAGWAAAIAYAAVLLLAVARGKGDFYEDVLQATEASFSAITAKKEGKLAEAAPAHVKVGKTGIGRGQGAGVLFYKHLLENRRARLFLLDATSLLFIALTVGYAVLMRRAGVIAVLVFSTYLQVFTVGMGRWLRELTLPFIYLMPQPAMRKLLYACAENALKMLTESLLLYLLVGVVLGLNPLVLAACVWMRLGFGVLFMSGNILAERLFGSVSSKTLMLFLYLFMMLLLCVPGVVLGIVAGAALGAAGAGEAALAAGIAVVGLCNGALALLIGFLCRNILDYAELNNR